MSDCITAYLGEIVEVGGVRVKIVSVDQHSEGESKPRTRVTLEPEGQPKPQQEQAEPKRRIGMPKR
jgi:hypothetical protein